MLAFRISRELYTVAKGGGYENRACVYTIFFNLGRRGRSIDVALIHGALNEMDAPSFPSRYPSPFRFPFAVKEETRKEDSVKAKKRLKFANITETVLPRIAFGF